MIRILIADDHGIVHHGVRQLVAEAADMTVVGAVYSGPEAVALAQRLPCDVVVLDISMPGRGGLEALKELKQLRPRLPVLILSMHPEEQYAVRALKAGAAGYLTKDSAPEELLTAIRKVVAGGRYVSAGLAERLAHELTADPERPPHAALSDREYQVLCLIAAGKSVTEIADALALSVKTVSTYRARILEKMGMENNAELMRYALRNELVK